MYKQEDLEVEVLQVGKPLEMLQPSVGDLGADEVEPLQISQPLEMHQSGVSEILVLGEVDLH